jgi:hypothetical protein
MKKTIIKVIKLSCCVLAFGFASVSARSGYAGTASSWAGHPQLLQPITTNDQVSTLKPGSKVTITCAKCKTVQIAEVDKKHTIFGWFKPDAKHPCPGCGGTWQYVNVAKGTHGGYMHTCSKCGSKSAFCCGVTVRRNGPKWR